MICPTCKGARFVQGEPTVAFGREYPTTKKCPDCQGDGHLSSPKFGIPKVEKGPSTEYPKNRNLQAETADWIRTHPLASDLLLKYARELAARGRRIGVKMLVERVRYDGFLNGWKADDYQINNSYTAYIARWLIAQDPSLEQRIEFRVTKW